MGSFEKRKYLWFSQQILLILLEHLADLIGVHANDGGNVVRQQHHTCVAFFIEYNRTKKSKFCCHPPFYSPNFCCHSLKLLSPTLPKLVNWILLSPPPLSYDPDNPPKFGTCRNHPWQIGYHGNKETSISIL